jgi:hypothetical protein
MRICLNCHRVTVGEPLFCNFCGRSFDAKLCPARHINPRNAEACSQCGSRDLTTPAPHAPIWLVPVLWTFKLLPGVLLLLMTVGLLVGLVQALVSNQQVMGQFLAAGLLLAVLWYAYLQLPSAIRKLFHIPLGKKKDIGHKH